MLCGNILLCEPACEPSLLFLRPNKNARIPTATRRTTPPIAIPAIAPFEILDPDDEFGDDVDIPVDEEDKVDEEDTAAEPVGEVVGEDDVWGRIEDEGSCSKSTIDDHSIASATILPPSFSHLQSYSPLVDLIA